MMTKFGTMLLLYSSDGLDFDDISCSCIGYTDNVCLYHFSTSHTGASWNHLKPTKTNITSLGNWGTSNEILEKIGAYAIQKL